MNAEIITIGDEILIGQIVDTNSAWMAKRLNETGISVYQITSVKDREKEIIQAIDGALSRTPLVLMTGGLGPTNDDVTKKALCTYFDSQLVFDNKAFEIIQQLFSRYGKEVTPLNKGQAELPQGCIVLYNYEGTAPGLWFEKNGNILIALPGVPYEMKSLMTKEVLPRLQSKFNIPPVFHQSIVTIGIGESFLADRIKNWEEALPKHIKLAYLPSPGMVKLRLSANGADEAIQNEIKNQMNNIMPVISGFVVGFDDDTIESVVGKKLTTLKKTLAIAESCTGGYLSHLLTTVAGSSDYYIGSVIAYDNMIKVGTLDISVELLQSRGAVSEEVVRAMASGVREKFNSHFGLATTGIAGPGGATTDKPVGTVWIALSSEIKNESKLLRLGTDRLRNIRIASINALKLLLDELKIIEGNKQKSVN